MSHSHTPISTARMSAQMPRALPLGGVGVRGGGTGTVSTGLGGSTGAAGAGLGGSVGGLRRRLP